MRSPFFLRGIIMRGVIGTLIVVGALALCGTTRAGKGAAKPEEAFQAMVEAAKKEDMKALLSTLTKDSQKVLTGSMVAMAVGMKQVAKILGGDPKEIGDILTKHDVKDEKVIEEMKKVEGTDKKTSPKDIVEALRKLADHVKDGPTFSGEVVAALKKLGKKGPDDPIKELREATLKSVKTEGEAARGEAVIGGKNKDIHFVREDGAWKVNLVPMILAELKMAP